MRSTIDDDIYAVHPFHMTCWGYGFVQPEEGAETAKDDCESILVRPVSKRASLASLVVLGRPKLLFQGAPQESASPR